jgi:hypothetical protein
MHDKYGREIRIGDVVKFKDYQTDLLGHVDRLQPGSETCNIYIAAVVSRPAVEIKLSNAKDCEIIARANGDHPEQPVIQETVPPQTA